MINPSPIEGHISLPQDKETPLTPLETAFGTALALYNRSIDSIQGHTIGQDYVTFRYGPTGLTFAVCDGVGQSFMGDLAARLLGDALINWLWSAARPASAETFSQEIAAALDRLSERTGQVVADYELPAGLPPMLVQALENQRTYGSESMFVAGRLALGPDDPWVGLCWLGDSPVAAVDIDGILVDLGPKGATSERWNAATGLKGEIHTWLGGAHNVARVVGYTDGLGLNHAPTDAELARLMEEWGARPPADDASLFDVRLAPSPQTVGPAAPHPRFQADETRPILLEGLPKTPLTDLTPLDAIPPSRSSVGEWRPLVEQAAQSKGQGPDHALPTDLGAQQQIRVWQQAALLGLTSAALAMLMLERLIEQQDTQKGQDDSGAA
jgi:Protein phosphatase 2C